MRSVSAWAGRMQAHHAEEALDDAAAAFGGGAHFFGARLGLRIGGKFVQQRRLRDHHGQRVVELVRDAGEQRAHRRHLLVLVQLLALAVDLLLGPPALAQVADRAEEEAAVGDLHLGRGELDREHLAGGVLGHRLHAAGRPSARRGRPCIRAPIGVALAIIFRDEGVEQVLADDVGALASRTCFSAAGLNSMIVPVSSMTMMASSEACSMVRRMTSLTWASDGRTLDGVAERQRDDLHRRLFLVGPARARARSH